MRWRSVSMLYLCTSLMDNPSPLYRSLLDQLNEYETNVKITFRGCMNEESDHDLHVFVKVYFCAKTTNLNCIRSICLYLWCIGSLDLAWLNIYLAQTSCCSMYYLSLCQPIFVPTIRHTIANNSRKNRGRTFFIANRLRNFTTSRLVFKISTIFAECS